MNANNKRIAGILLAIIGLLLLPAVAMVFSDAVQWTLFDFVVAGALLLAAGLTYEFFARRGHSRKYRVTAGIVVAALLVVAWLELAVGLFGTRWAGS
jgi:predicted PurR-regulated permease PerM